MEDKVKKTKVETLVSEVFCFRPKSEHTVVAIQKALSCYSENLEKEIELESETPIFLDTNVLLDYYKLSFSERKSLISFLDQNKSKLFITNQVEQEFLKHRVNHIKNYLNSVEEFVNSYRNIKNEIDNLKKGEIKGFQHYLDQNKILKNDHQDLHNELSELHDTLKGKLTDLFSDIDLESQLNEKEIRIEEIKKRLEGDADIERKDPLLSVISHFNFLAPLSEDEIFFVKKLYKTLMEEYELVKGEQKEFYKKTFPGCGDKKDEPEGDLIIYHEIAKYMKDHSSDAIFLTNDVEKNDWLLRNKTELVPFSHYIINTHSITGKTLYIFQSRDKIRLSYNSIYMDDESIDNEGVILENLDNVQELEGPKVLGKIEIPNKTSKQHFSFYEEISESEFLNQLKQSEFWAKKYGDGFVGIRNFIETFLGDKGYHYSASYDAMRKLIEKELIEEYTHEPTEAFYNPVKSVRIKKQVPSSI